MAEKGRDLIQKWVKSEQGCGFSPLGRDIPSLPSMGLRPLHLPLAFPFSHVLKSPGWLPLLQPCQGPTLWPQGPALGCHSIITLQVPLPGGLSASHQMEGSDCFLLVVGASVPAC